MIIANLHTVLDTEPCVVTGELRVWGNMREDGKDELVWEFENYENGTKQINFQYEGLVVRVRTEAGLGCGRSEGNNDWASFQTEAIRELGEER